MKTLIQKSLVLLLFIIAAEASAQVKKATVTAKPKQVSTVQVPTKSLVAELLRSNTEQACRLLSNELKGIGIRIESMDEESVYEQKNKSPLQLRTSLKCSDKIQVDVIANQNDQILSVDWYVNEVSQATFTTIEKILGYQKWPIITKENRSALYLSNNMIVNVNNFGSTESDHTKSSYAIHLTKSDRFISSPTAKLFNIDSLSVHSNGEEIGQSVVQFLKGQGLKFLYKSLKDVSAASGEKGISEVVGYTTTYMFDEGTYVSITSNKYQKTDGLNFYFSDPLVHNKIKRWFRFSNWTEGGEGDEEGDVIYTKNNVECLNNDKFKYIQFTISPVITDIKTRYQNTYPIDASSLVADYFNMNKEALKTYLTKTYANMVSIDWANRKMTYSESADPYTFYFKSPADSLSVVIYEYKLSNTWSRIAYFGTRDKAYFEQMKNELVTQSKDAKSKVIINYGDKPNEKTGMHYVLIFSKAQEAIFAENKRKEADALAAQQQREKEAAAEKERLRAEKAAKTSEDIQKLGDILIQGIQQMKKKGNN